MIKKGHGLVADAFHPVKYSPLSGLSAPAGGIDLSERRCVGKVNVRGDPSNPEFVARVRQALNIELPLSPNTTRISERFTVFWFGPNEWLIHCAEDAQTEVVATLRQDLKELHAAITDVTDYYMVIRLSGVKAREVLSKGTPFDVHHKVFGPGACAQTCFGHASILLHCVDDSPAFDFQVRWSFAEYLWRYLVDAAKEYTQ